MVGITCCGDFAAVAGDKAEKSKDKPFVQRLQDHEIQFTDQSLSSVPVDRAMKDKLLADDPWLNAAVGQVLTRLLTAHVKRGAPAIQMPPFFVVDGGSDFECSVPPNGSSITCTRYAVETLYKEGMGGEAQLAFLIGHELAHVTLADHRKRFTRSEKLKSSWTTIGLVGALGAVAAISNYKMINGQLTVHSPADAGLYFWNAALSGMEVGDLADALIGPTWGMNDEDEADAYAVILMHDAGYDTSQAAVLLDIIHQNLLRRHQGGSVAGSVLKGAATNAAVRAVLTNGDKLSVITGSITGGLKGLSAATAHYHRAADKRADNCRKLAADLEGDAAHDERLAMMKMMKEGAGAPTDLRQASLTVEQPAPSPSPSKLRRGSKSRSPDVRAAKATAAPKTPWQLFLERDRLYPEMTLGDTVRVKIRGKDIAGATALCDTAPTPHTVYLGLACAMAYVGAKDNVRANRLLKNAAGQPDASADDLRLIAQLQGSLNDYDGAKRTLDMGLKRFPDGVLYPDKMMVSAATGDVEGVKATALECRKQASKEYQDSCNKALLAMNIKV
jgi:predicted Zn-dependent protease